MFVARPRKRRNGRVLGAALTGEGLLDGRQLVIRPLIAPSDELAAEALLDHLEGPEDGGLECALGDPVAVLALSHERVGQVIVHGRGHIGGQRPGRGGPDQQPLTRSIDQREANGEPRVLAILVALVDLGLAHARPAAGAPGHGVVSLVQPTPPMDLRQEGPDEVVVLVGESEVRAG